MFGNSHADGYTRVAVIPSGKEDADKIHLKHALIFAFQTPLESPIDHGDFDKKIRSALDNISYISDAKAKRIEPLRVKIHTVRAGDSIASLSQKMDTGPLAADLFQTINALDAGDPLIPGMQVKLVVDPNKGKF